MPNQDGSGPQGLGSKTGRGLGPCNPGSNVVAPQGGAGLQPGRGTGGRAGQFGTNRGSGFGGQRKGGGRGSGRRR